MTLFNFIVDTANEDIKLVTWLDRNTDETI